ncbi:MAG: hypothetical protein EXR99_03180 [Gemmataceae bacterium]|nr:hypothetical protein [Gemmataceae bacterium]
MEKYPLGELKLIYRALHGSLSRHPELLDSDFLLHLQNHLQAAANKEGVDLSNHASWDAWLGQEAGSCEARVQNRQVWN